MQITYLIIIYSECKTVITQIFFKNHTINERRWASLVAQIVMNLPAMQETWVQSLGGEDPLEKEMATHCNILAWEFHEHGRLVGYSPWG